MQTGGNEAYKLFQVKESFDVLNIQAVKAADKFTAELVKEVNNETRKGIRTYISTGIREGKSMDKIARELRPLVGLTENQTQSIINYRKLLSDKKKFPGLSVSDIDKKVDKYAGKTHRRRTQTIARTETARAQNVGYVQGLENTGVEKVEFSAAPGCCDICSAMNKNTYPLDKASAIIPVHPNCRCAMLPVVADVPVCRGVGKSLKKAKCIPPDNLGREHVKDLYDKLEHTNDPDKIKDLSLSLRLMGQKIPPEKLKLIPKPKPKPIRVPSADANKVASDFVERLTSSGGPIELPPLTKPAEQLLRATAVDDEYHLYRGISAIKGRFSTEQWKVLKKLKVGDDIPKFLYKKSYANEYASYTKKVSVANAYSKGQISIVIEADVPKKAVLVDLERTSKLKGNVFTDKDNIKYYKLDKEVLTNELPSNFVPKIKSIKI